VREKEAIREILSTPSGDLRHDIAGILEELWETAYNDGFKDGEATGRPGGTHYEDAYNSGWEDAEAKQL